MSDANDNDGNFSLKEINGTSATFTAKLTNTDSTAHSYQFNDYGGVYHEDPLYESSYIQGLIDSNVSSNSTLIEEPWDAVVTGSNVSASENEVTVPANGEKTVTFTVNLATAGTKEFVEGYVGFDSTDGTTPNLHMPWLGFSGDYGNWSDNIISYDDGSGDGAMNLYTGEKYASNENGEFAISPNSEDGRTEFSLVDPVVHFARKVETSVASADNTLTRALDTHFALRKGENQFPIWDGGFYNANTGKYNYAKDGKYTYQLKSENSFSTTPQTKNVTVNVDSVAPTIKNLKVYELPRDKDDPFIQEQAAKGVIIPTSLAEWVYFEVDDNVGFDKSLAYTVYTPLGNFTGKVGKAAGKNHIFQQVQAASFVRNVTGVLPMIIGLVDSAGNYGEGYGEFTNGDGLTLYDATLNGKQVVSQSSGYVEQANGKNYYHLQGNFATSENKELYVNNQKISLNSDGTFDAPVELPGALQWSEYYFTNEKYSSLDEAKANAFATAKLGLSGADLTLDTKFAKNYPLMTGKIDGNPVTAIDGLVYEPQVKVTVSSPGSDQIGVRNYYQAPDNYINDGTDADTATFNLPLVTGVNYFLASAQRNDGEDFGVTETYHGLYITKGSQVDAIQFKDLTTLTPNVMNEETAVQSGLYDAQTGLFTIDGTLADLDASDLKIYGYSDDKKDERNIVSLSAKNKFSYKLPLAPGETKQVKYSYLDSDNKEVNGTVIIEMLPLAPSVTFDGADNWVKAADGYDVYTNKDSVKLSGTITASEKDRVISVYVDGSVVAKADYDSDLTADKTKPITFDKEITLLKGEDGAEKVTNATLEVYSETTGETTTEQIRVHRKVAAPSEPQTTVSNTNPTFGSVSVTATSEADTSIEWSADGKNWTDYTEAVNVNKNCTLYFRATDKYGNVSQTRLVEISNIYSDVAATFAVYTQNKNKKLVTMTYNQKLPEALASQLKLQYSLDNGKTWTNYTKAIQVKKQKADVKISGRVALPDGTYSEISEAVVEK
jgi:lactocepin